MPDEKPGQPIEQQPQAPPLATPQPENDQTSSDTTTVREQKDEARIETLEDRMGRAQRIMAWLTGAIALFALGSVVVGFLQWGVMSRQLDDSEASQRAALVIKDYSGEFIKLPGYQVSTIRVTFTLKNAGGSVAKRLNVQETCGFANRRAEPQDKIIIDIPPLASGPSLGPGDTRVYTSDCTSSGVDNALTGKEFFRHVVQVGYQTAFGNSVISDCLVYETRRQRFTTCPAEKQQ